MAELKIEPSVIVVLFTLCLVCCQEDPLSSSICRSMAYRHLDAQSQNEHQCIVMEKLQRDFEEDKNNRIVIFNDIIKRIEKLGKKITRLKKAQEDTKEKPLKFSPTFSGIPLVRDCHELLMHGVTVSGVYPIKLPLGRIVNVWCDMETDNGGWTVFQRRLDGSVNFNRTWDDYTFGFGNSNSEYWFGNDNLYQMTSYFNYTLRIDLWGWQNDHAYAEYKDFFISSESGGFRISVNGYQGTAGDSLAYHNDMKFTTPDRDNDKWDRNCGHKDQAGWWYKNCGFSSLNGRYIPNGNVTIEPDGIIRGVIWFHWKWLYYYSLRKSEMKIKPSLAVKIEREIIPQIDDPFESLFDDIDDFDDIEEVHSEEVQDIANEEPIDPTDEEMQPVVTTTSTAPPDGSGP